MSDSKTPPSPSTPSEPNPHTTLKRAPALTRVATKGPLKRTDGGVSGSSGERKPLTRTASVGQRDDEPVVPTTIEEQVALEESLPKIKELLQKRDVSRRSSPENLSLPSNILPQDAAPSDKESVESPSDPLPNDPSVVQKPIDISTSANPINVEQLEPMAVEPLEKLSLVEPSPIEVSPVDLQPIDPIVPVVAEPIVAVPERMRKEEVERKIRRVKIDVMNLKFRIYFMTLAGTRKDTNKLKNAKLTKCLVKINEIHEQANLSTVQDDFDPCRFFEKKQKEYSNVSSQEKYILYSSLRETMNIEELAQYAKEVAICFYRLRRNSLVQAGYEGLLIVELNSWFVAHWNESLKRYTDFHKNQVPKQKLTTDVMRMFYWAKTVLTINEDAPSYKTTDFFNERMKVHSRNMATKPKSWLFWKMYTVLNNTIITSPMLNTDFEELKRRYEKKDKFDKSEEVFLSVAFGMTKESFDLEY